METLSVKPVILGLYLSDTRDVYNNTTTKSIVNKNSIGYLPIVELFDINRQEEVRFIDGKNISGEVVSYNRNTSSQSLDHSAIINSRLNVTQNDLLLGPVYVVLNLTQYNITMSVAGDHRKVFRPLESKRFEDYYGKVLIVTLSTFNNPKQIRDIQGYSNYLESLIDMYKQKGNKRHSEMIDLLTFINEHVHDVEMTTRFDKANTIKVSTLMEIDGDKLTHAKDKTLFIPEKDILITLEDIVAAPMHPSTSGLLVSGDVRSQLKENSIVCYIVDNSDIIGDRYMNFAGNVRKIVKVKNPSLVNGLYVITSNQSGSSDEFICRLEDLDSNQYVYKSVEEANIGADVRKQYSDKLELLQRELDSERIRQQNESIRLKKEAEETKAEYERRLRDQTLSFEQRMHELKHSADSRKFQHEQITLKAKEDYDYFKFDMDRRNQYVKNQYESEKYSRDSTLETLKMLGAVAGLVAGGVVLYGKLNK